MKNIGKEIVIGFVPVLFIFLAFLGVNVAPLLVFGVVASLLFYTIRSRSGAGFGGENRLERVVPQTIRFDQIGGQERAKRELVEALDFLVRREELKHYGIRPLKGILLTGPPGTGKTLMAKASANYTDSVFIPTSGSEFIEMYVGVGAGRIRDLFKEARKKAAKLNKSSAIIFIDEIDVIGGKRDGQSHKEYDQTLNQLLTEMDGMLTTDNPAVLVIAATNRKEMLDPALLRPGRFDRHITVDLPDKKARLQILKIHAENKPMDESVDLDKLAAETFGFSGAQLESVMNEGAIYSLREQSAQINHQHVAAAIDKVMLGEKTDREATSEEKQRVAYHELGHAIISEKVRPGSVSQVALSPRGQALGYVRHNPQKDHYLYTLQHLQAQVMVCLGGAAAEELVYGQRSTGSKNDFEQAMNLVKMMMDAGLTTLGIIDIQLVKKEDIQREATKILDQLMEQTKEMLSPYKPAMDQALSILSEQEVLSGDRFRELLHEMEEALVRTF